MSKPSQARQHMLMPSSQHCICGAQFLVNETNKVSSKESPIRNQPHTTDEIAIEGPDKLSESDIEQVISIWNRKPRRVSV